MKKRILAILLAVCIVLSTVPAALATSTTECTESCTHAAVIGSTHYDTLQEACDAAKDGETVTLLSEIKFTKETAFENNGWYDGVKYTGDQSFTIDLNGKTISDNGELNDYLLYFMNKGSKANEITLKNGTISGGANLWNVICIGAGSETYPTTFNLGSNLTINADGSGNSGEDGAAKVRGNSVMNVLSGTTVISAAALYGVQAAAVTATLNIYNGASVAMNMSTGAAVTGVGIVNIYGGTITSEGWAVYTSTSGTPVFTIYGGTITGTGGAVAAAADFNSYGNAAPTVNIANGVVNGKIEMHLYGTPAGENCAKMNVTGGTFDTDVSAYVAYGYKYENGSVIEDNTVGVAKIGATKYATLAAAIDAAASGGTVTLLDNVTLTESVNVTGTVTLDLNGCTITNATTAPITLDGGTLTVKDSSEAQTGAIVAASTSENNDDKAAILFTANYSGKLILESGTLKSTKYGIRSTQGTSKIVISGGTIDAEQYGVIAYPGTTVTLNGGTIKSGIYGIAAYGTFTMNGGTIKAKCGYISNGSRDGTVAVINDGIIEASDYVGIYWPSNGNLTINGGTITGATAVSVKSGSLSITGGTLIGTGEKEDYKYSTSGGAVTGDALLIENVGGDTGYEAISSVSITGGTFKSTNASAVASYAATAANAEAAAVDDFIFGGKFTSANAEYTITDYVPEDGYAWEGYPEDGDTSAYTWLVGPSYLISINPNGGSFAEGEGYAITTMYGGLLDLGIVNTEMMPSRSGYTFKGWYDAAEGGNQITAETVFTENTTIYAQWTINQYTVTFDAATNGGSCDTANATVTHGGTISALPTASKSGYWYFNGWYTAASGGTQVTTETTFTANTTVYAQFYYSEPYYPTYTPTVTPTVTPSTSTETTENEDGSTTTTVTNNKTGTVTETTENTDGSTTTVETQKDGTVTETVENTDGSTQVTETKAETTVKDDGTTETKTESTTTATDADGNVTTSTITATETTSVTDEGATVTEKVEQTKTESAEAVVETTTTATTTATEEKTETVAVTEETTTKADGTTETKTTTTTETELADGTTATAVTDESGKTEAEVVISEEAAASEDPVALPIPAVTASTDSEAASTVTVTTNSETDTAVVIPVAEGTGAGTVAVIVNADGTETVVTESVVTENGLEVAVPDGATIKVVDNSTDFTDVADNDWEKDAVDFTSARGIMQGTSTGENATFDSDTPTTRAMVWTMLARLSGVDTTPAEGESWWSVGQKWAMENGISDGTMHDGEITREQLATMLYRFAGSPETDHDITHFDDHHETSDWALAAKEWAVANGVISGVGQADGSVTLEPKGNAIRSHVAQMFMNFMTKIDN